MLNSLLIKNFAIIEDSEIIFKKGMTTITGETGAGKSILLDALNIVLGSRVDKNALNKTSTTQICANFDISGIPLAKEWITEHDLDNNNECLLRRTIKPDGKSKAYINGTPATLNQVKSLANLLINLYSQHAHYDLLDKETQLARLDIYAGHSELLDSVQRSYQELINLNNQLQEKLQQKDEQHTRQELLQYQFEELKQLDLQKDELEQLDLEQNNLANAEEQISCYQMCNNLIYDADQSVFSQLEQCSVQISNNIVDNEKITNVIDLIEQAKVYTQEAYQELNRILDKIEINPAKLQDTEERLTEIFSIARKHRLNPNLLYSHFLNVQKQISSMDSIEQEISALKHQLKQTQDSYNKIATNLSNSRKKHAIAFAKEIEYQIKSLNIPNGVFKFDLTNTGKPTQKGQDQGEFLISFNKGQDLAPISKIASGGELSRIGLAIQVISSKRLAPATILFDEVDVGISGATSEIVGNLLYKISKHAQIICITHQAQVAAQADHQLHISKSVNAKRTVSTVTELDNSARIDELAKILGGVEITQHTLSHAKEMFEKLQMLG